MNNTDITVYITNYNYEKYIRKAIESVLHQSFQQFELFIIDDGSTDNSRKIIESYAGHEKIKIIYQRNKGLNITNNIAMRLAMGKYIMRLDADDYLAPTALEQMYNQLEEDPNLGLVFPNYYLVDASDNVTAEVKRHDFKKEVTLLDQPAHGACTMIRLNFLRAVGGYDEQYSCQDGYELWIKFIAHFKVANNNNLLFYYRRHGENLTTNESRILNTRRTIKDDFILKNEITRPNTIGIIPIRGTKINNVFLAFLKLGEEYLIDIKIKTALKSNLLKKVIVTSNEPKIQAHIEYLYAKDERIQYVERPSKMVRYNVSLNDTIEHILGQPNLTHEAIETFMVLPIEYPFLKVEDIDDAINSLAIFKADSLLSVRIERSTFYQHHGDGMVPILGQDKFAKLEREALYKGIGGITICMVDAFLEEKKILPGKVGHNVVDQLAAHGVFSAYDLDVAKFLARKNQLFKKTNKKVV